MVKIGVGFVEWVKIGVGFNRVVHVAMEIEIGRASCRERVSPYV